MDHHGDDTVEGSKHHTVLPNLFLVQFRILKVLHDKLAGGGIFRIDKAKDHQGLQEHQHAGLFLIISCNVV